MARPCEHRNFLESYNSDSTIESNTKETPKASYLLGSIKFCNQSISTIVWVCNVIKWNGTIATSPSTSRKLCPKEPQPKLAKVILTIFICSFRMITFFFLWLHYFFAACNVSLERYSQGISNGMLHTPRFLKFQLLSFNFNLKKNRSHLATADEVGQKNRNWFWLRYFLA